MIRSYEKRGNGGGQRVTAVETLPASGVRSSATCTSLIDIGCRAR